MTRPPGEDPAEFAIALETLARRAFVDVDAAVRLQLVRDKLITGQKQLALCRHLDSAGRTPGYQVLLINAESGRVMRKETLDPELNVNQGFFK